jgi:hypothetical protein
MDIETRAAANIGNPVTFEFASEAVAADRREYLRVTRALLKLKPTRMRRRHRHERQPMTARFGGNKREVTRDARPRPPVPSRQ